MADITSGLAYVIIILFFIVSMPRDDRSYLGIAGLAFDNLLTNFFGTSQMARCPFLRKGMIIHQFTEYTYPINVTACSGECDVNCDGDDYSANNITVFESTLMSVPIGLEPSCDLDNFVNFVEPEGGILKCDSDSSNCNRRTTASAVCGQGSAQLTVCLKCKNGPCTCENSYGDMEPCNLDEFIVQTFLSDQADKERELFSLMGTDMPPWVCYVVFGIFPFVVIYFFVQDLLQFTVLRPTTKRAVALTVGMIGIFSGAFVGITVGLVKFMSFSTGNATLYLIIGVAILTSFMLIFQTTFRPIATGSRQATQLKYSIDALTKIYKDVAAGGANVIICDKCKAKNDIGAKHCRSCGATNQCSICKHMNALDAETCEGCGAEWNDDSGTWEKPPSPVA